MSRPTRLLVFGFDAGHPEELIRWANEGHLPALAGILERGAWAATTGPELLSEHGVWVPLLSGVSRGALGYHYFRQLAPGTYDLRPVTALDLRFSPFWERLVPGRPQTIFDVPEIMPGPASSGVHLANWAAHLGWRSRHPAHQPQSRPTDLLTRLAPRFGRPEVILEEPASTTDQDRAILRRLLARVGRKGALARHLMADPSLELGVVVFTESHTAGHQFWKYRPAAPESDRKDAAPDLQHAIREVYRRIDQELGLLVRSLPSDATVVVVSSVGIEDHFPTEGLTDSFCRVLGYQASPPPAGRPRGPMALARRVLPESFRTVLSRRLLTRDQREALVADAFRRGTDWCRTTAFAVPTFYAGQIRVNLKGREPEGTVSPGQEYEALLQRLEQDLRALRNPDDGAPAVRAIHRPGLLYGDNPPTAFPDLWVEWAATQRFVARLEHPRGEIHQRVPEFLRDSDHGKTGFLAAAGPGIAARGMQPPVDVLDVTPTLLRLLGAGVPSDLTGRPLARWLDPELTGPGPA